MNYKSFFQIDAEASVKLLHCYSEILDGKLNLGEIDKIQATIVDKLGQVIDEIQTPQKEKT